MSLDIMNSFVHIIGIRYIHMHVYMYTYCTCQCQSVVKGLLNQIWYNYHNPFLYSVHGTLQRTCGIFEQNNSTLIRSNSH